MAFRSAAIVDLFSDGSQSYQEHCNALLRHLDQVSSPRRLNEVIDKFAIQVLQARNNNDGCGGTYSCTLYVPSLGDKCGDRYNTYVYISAHDCSLPASRLVTDLPLNIVYNQISSLYGIITELLSRIPFLQIGGKLYV